MDAPHLQRLGLARNPFPPTPDALHYFFTPMLEREFAEALHCLLAGKGFVLLSGEVGMGKSTFVRRLIDALHEREVRVALVLNTFLQGADLLCAINRDFGLAPGADLAEDIERLNAFLLEQHRAGRACVLLIDDAQNLSLESLELVRLLTNLETGQEKLLQIVLAGQPELQDSLARQEIRQLASRIVKHLHLRPLDPGETGRYVDFRLATCGAAGRVRLSPGGLRKLMACSGGNPRRIHLIMDRCLYGVLLREDRLIDAALVGEAAAEAGFQRPARLRPAYALGALAAALLLGTGLLAAQTWSTDVPEALSVAPLEVPPPEALLAPVEAPQGVAAAWQRCQAQLAEGAQAPDLRSVQVPRARLEQVLASGRGCLLAEGEPALVLWRPALRSEWITSPQANPHTLGLQAQLAAQALYPGAQDGRWGPLTREALKAFQARQGLPETGIPDDLTLSLLPAGPAPVLIERQIEREEEHENVEG